MAVKNNFASVSAQGVTLTVFHAIGYQVPRNIVPPAMKPEILRNPRSFSYPGPRSFEIRPRLAIVTRKDIGAIPFHFGKHAKRPSAHGTGASKEHAGVAKATRYPTGEHHGFETVP